MADVIFNKITDTKLMPIRAISFYLTTSRGYSETHFFEILHLEKESSYRITPKTRRTHRNEYRTLGYFYEMNLYVPHNQYSSNGLLNKLEEMTAKGFDSQLVLGNHITPVNTTENDGHGVINATSGMWMDNNTDSMESMHFEIEGVEYRPRLIMRIKGFTNNPSSLFGVT